MVFELPLSNLYRVTYVQQVTYIKLVRLDMEQLNSIFKESAELFKHIKVIRYNSDIVQLFLYANLQENCVFIREKRSHLFPKSFTVQNVFLYLRTHDIFLFSFCITYYKSFYAFCILCGRFEF